MRIAEDVVNNNNKGSKDNNTKFGTKTLLDWCLRPDVEFFTKDVYSYHVVKQ